MKEYALKFVSGKYQGGQFRLSPETDIIIGRATDVDMVVVEDMVSRRHALISTKGGKVTLRDLGSTNGTFLNGERVGREPVEVKEGDRILIGSSVLKLVAYNASEPAHAQRSEDSFEDRHTTVSITRHMTGAIEEIPLPDLLQLLSNSRKSGVLVIHSGPREGRIYMKDGQVSFAIIDNNFEVGPEKSFYRIMRWNSGTFELLPPDDSEFMTEIQESTSGLIMEAMRLLDEINRLGDRKPDVRDIYALAHPMTPPLRDLSPEQLDVLQAVHNHGKIGVVLDKVPHDDLVIYESLIYLIENRYLKKLD